MQRLDISVYSLQYMELSVCIAVFGVGEGGLPERLTTGYDMAIIVMMRAFHRCSQYLGVS